jgi:hypothetical protein
MHNGRFLTYCPVKCKRAVNVELFTGDLEWKVFQPAAGFNSVLNFKALSGLARWNIPSSKPHPANPLNFQYTFDHLFTGTNAGDDPVNRSDPTGLWVFVGGIGQTFTWQEAEDFVEAGLSVTGADPEPQVPFRIPLFNNALRRVDVYAWGPGWMNEVKTGSQYRSARGTPGNSRQSLWDEAILVGEGTLNGVPETPNGDTWWFFPNTAGVTHPSIPLIRELVSRGINAAIFYYVPGDSPELSDALWEAAESNEAPIVLVNNSVCSSSPLFSVT